MRFFLRYLSLEGKKSLIAARKSMVKFIVMLLLIAGGVLAVSLVMKDAGVFQTAEIGVVIPEDEAQTKMVAQFISAMDSVKSVCHFQYLNQDKAMASLEKGTLDAVLSLPEQFYEDVDSGKNTPATIYFPENAPLNTRVFGELVADGVSLLRTAEAGVYATYDTAQIYQAEISRDQIGDVISELYIYEAFDRTSVFQKNVYSSLGKADIHQYYFSAAVLLLFLMMGVNYGYLYQKQSRAVEEKIRIYGIGEGKNALIKVLLMTVPLWLVGVLVYAVGCLVSGKYHLSFLWFDREVLPGTLLLAAVIAAYFQLIYTISGESTRGTIVLLAVNVFQIMASGVVIPTAYLPELFGKIGTFFPLTFWDSYYLKLLFFGIKGQETRQLILMLAVLFAASVLWAKAAGHFGKVEREEHKKGGSLTVGGFGKSALFNWYFLQLKARLKRGTSLLLLASMFFVVWFAGQISMPQSDNVTVGIVETDGTHGKEVLEHLHEITSHIQNDNVNRSKMFTELSDLIDRFNRPEKVIFTIFSILSLVCILISTFGIYSLVSLATEQRRKEIAIRKVNGATFYHILQLFFREYFILVTLGNVFALPVGYLVIKRWLETYANHTTLPAGLFLLVFLITCGIVLLSIFRQVKRAAATNPAEVIKTE